MQVLAELLEHRGEVVSKGVLTDTVWQNTFVTDDSLVQCIADIRRALGDTDHDIVQTVPMRGYLVVATTVANADVDDERNGAQPERWRRHSRTMPALATVLALLAVGFGYLVLRADHSQVAAGSSVPLPRGPRIVLVPFQNLGEDAGDAFFSEGLTRDINAQLSRFSNLFVIAPEAAASFRENPDCNAIREELRADYILTGTAQRYRNRVRVTTAFLDAKTCQQLTPPGPFDCDLNIDDGFCRKLWFLTDLGTWLA